MRYFYLILCFFFFGCATTSARINNLNLGMSKSEVIKIMGSPNATKAKDNTEILEYFLHPANNYWTSITYPEPYWIFIVDGKVSQYGKAGDFGTSMPADRREYNININQE